MGGGFWFCAFGPSGGCSNGQLAIDDAIRCRAFCVQASSMCVCVRQMRSVACSVIADNVRPRAE